MGMKERCMWMKQTEHLRVDTRNCRRRLWNGYRESLFYLSIYHSRFVLLSSDRLSSAQALT